MIKPKRLSLAVLFFSVLVIALVFNKRIDQKTAPETIVQRETAFEDIKDGSVKNKTAKEETIGEEKIDEADINKADGIEEGAGSVNYHELNWQWVNGQEKLYNLSPADIELILIELKKRFPEKSERLRAISFLRLGTPYQLGPLGEEKGRDSDPIFRIDVADCTVFVLTNVALLYSGNLEEARGSLSPRLISPLAYAREMMKFLNYRSAEINFENRLHFSTDRNSVSPYFRDITEEIAGAKTQKKTVVLNKKRADGTRLIDIDWEREIVLKYIPSQHITGDFLANLLKVTGVAFIREGDEEIGLDIRHEGFLFDGKTLIHASSVWGRVVEENFLDYYFIDQKKPRFDGIILFEIN